MSIGLHIWYAALAAQVGVVLECDDPDYTKQRLYALRTEAGDPDLESISIVQSPSDPAHLWLVKRDPHAT